MERRLSLALALGGLALALAAWAWLAAAGWQGEPNACLAAGDCFCEADRGGAVRQPSNTWSSLTYVAAALWILFGARLRGFGEFDRGLYALLAGLIGPTSMAFHASLTRWGGSVDMISMYLFVSFVLVHRLDHWYGLGRGRVFGLFAAINAVLIGIEAASATMSIPIFALLVAALIMAELARSFRGGPGAWTWLPSAGLFGLALLIWTLSRSGAPLCAPGSLVQGHAVWHALCAVASCTLFNHLTGGVRS